MKLGLRIMLILAMFLAGCSNKSDDPVVGVKAEDAEMNNAMAEAKSTVAGFVERMKNPQPKDYGFSVKKKIEDGDKVEFFWLSDITYADGKFTGTLGNNPQIVSNVEFGQKMSVGETEIADWMYLDGDKMVGNYTLRVLLKRMSKEEADTLRKQFQIDD